MPELLVSVQGNTVHAHPFAGTTPRTGDPDTDQRAAAELLASAKNQTEHRVVIDMIHDTLLPWCSYLDWEPEPSIVAVANVQHLGTRMEGHLSDPRPNVLELVRALAPTPAVGGFPRAEALALIERGRGLRARPLRRLGRLGRCRRRRHVGGGAALRRVLRRPSQRPAGRRRRHRRRQRAAGRAGRDPGQVPGDALGHRPAVTRISPSAATTAALSAAWTSTLSLRLGCHAHDTGVGLVERRGELVGRLGGVRAEAEARATSTMSVPWGVPNSCSNRSAGSAVACGRNEKIAPPSLSTTTIVRSSPRARSAVSDDMSWQNATSPSSTAVGAPLPSATPIAVAITPSMPLAPRLACTVMSLRGVPNHSTSRTGIDEATTRWPPAGIAAVIARATPGSERSAFDGQRGVEHRRGRRRRRRATRSSHAAIATLRHARRRGAEHSAPIGAWTCRAPTRFGSETSPTGDTATCVARRRGQPLRQHLRRRRHAQLQTPRRADGRRRTRRVASTASKRTTADVEHLASRQRVGQHRPARCSGKCLHRRAGRRRRCRRRSRPRDVASRSTRSVDVDERRRQVLGGDRGSGNSPTTTDQRLAERQVEVHRPGLIAGTHASTPSRCERSPRRALLVDRHAGIVEPAHGTAVQVRPGRWSAARRHRAARADGRR